MILPPLTFKFANNTYSAYLSIQLNVELLLNGVLLDCCICTFTSSK